MLCNYSVDLKTLAVNIMDGRGLNNKANDECLPKGDAVLAS